MRRHQSFLTDGERSAPARQKIALKMKAPDDFVALTNTIALNSKELHNRFLWWSSAFEISFGENKSGTENYQLRYHFKTNKEGETPRWYD